MAAWDQDTLGGRVGTGLGVEHVTELWGSGLRGQLRQGMGLRPSPSRYQ